MFMVATSVALWLGSGFAINIKGIFVAVISIWCVVVRIKYFIRRRGVGYTAANVPVLCFTFSPPNAIKDGVAVSQHRTTFSK